MQLAANPEKIKWNYQTYHRSLGTMKYISMKIKPKKNEIKLEQREESFAQVPAKKRN